MPLKIRYLFHFLIGLSALLAGYTGVKTTIKWLSYCALDAKTSAVIQKWEIAPYKEQLALKAAYSFSAKGQTFQEETLFIRPLYSSEWAAKHAIETLQQKAWEAHFNSKDPTKSSLQKLFPFQELIHFTLSFCLSVYFWMLKKYIMTSKGVFGG